MYGHLRKEAGQVGARIGITLDRLAPCDRRAGGRWPDASRRRAGSGSPAGANSRRADIESRGRCRARRTASRICRATGPTRRSRRSSVPQDRARDADEGRGRRGSRRAIADRVERLDAAERSEPARAAEGRRRIDRRGRQRRRLQQFLARSRRSRRGRQRRAAQLAHHRSAERPVPALTPEARQRQRGARWRRMRGRGPVRSPRAAAARRALHHVVRLERRAADAAELLLQQQLQIVQTKDHVMILVEMVHDVRDRPDGRRARSRQHIRPWMGDSIGRWEGDTLVVETTNFHPLQSIPRRVGEPEGHRALHARRARTRSSTGSRSTIRRPSRAR